ncbi:MAG: hypothetical protein DDT21_01909 [Syntrophomonadaceae bacterium]|nr:hypothetical protein [Bacillota bacterium]
MEMNTLSQLVPAMQSKFMHLLAGSGQQATGFAGLLALLLQQPGFGPEVAIVASQLAGSEEQKGALPKLLAALLPQMMPRQTPEGSASTLFQENGASACAALWLPAVLLGLPLQSQQFAEGGASGRACAGGATVLSGNLLQAAAAAELGAEKLQPETPAATLQDAVVVKWGAENLLPEPVTVISQAAAMAEQGAAKLLSETLPVEQNAAAADKPALEKGALLHLQTANKEVAELPVSRISKSESPSTIQGSSALSYQAFSDRQALAATAVRFAESPLGRAALAEQVLEKMVFRREPEGDSTLSVRLRPAALGEVQISLRLEEGRLVARIMTENLYVKDALDAALGQVKQRLEAQQIQVAELTVTVGSQMDFRQDRTFNPFWQQTEIKDKRPAMATIGAEGGGGQLVSQRQGLVDARV